MAVNKQIGTTFDSYEPRIATIIILRTTMANPLMAVPMVNLDTTFYPK